MKNHILNKQQATVTTVEFNKIANALIKETKMNLFIKASTLILLAALSLPGCSSAAKQDGGGYNSSGSQKTNAKHAQDELTTETAQ